MSDYIKREDIIEQFKVAERQAPSTFNIIDDIMDVIETLPSADVVEVRHGHWEQDGHHIRCSECGTYFCITDRDVYSFPINYCPCCGAKMQCDEERHRHDEHGDVPQADERTVPERRRDAGAEVDEGRTGEEGGKRMNALQIVCLIIISGCTGVLVGSTLADVYWTIRKARLKKKILDARDAQGDWLEKKNEGKENRP